LSPGASSARAYSGKSAHNTIAQVTRSVVFN
jgi:hypothetical protein